MKFSLLFTFLLSITSFAQTPITAANLSGGIEYQSKQTYAWNLDLTFNRELVNFDRFWSEFGMNYSVLEFNGGSNIEIDTSLNTLAPIGLYYEDYIYRTSTHYSRMSSLRLNVGINYDLIKKDKIKLSTGVNVVNQLLLRKREHGQAAYIPRDYSDTTNVVFTSYRSNQTLSSAPNAITILLQPHVDVAVPLSDHLFFLTRLSYYWKVLPTIEHSRAQFNLGLRYEW